MAQVRWSKLFLLWLLKQNKRQAQYKPGVHLLLRRKLVAGVVPDPSCVCAFTADTNHSGRASPFHHFRLTSCFPYTLQKRVAFDFAAVRLRRHYVVMNALCYCYLKHSYYNITTILTITIRILTFTNVNFRVMMIFRVMNKTTYLIVVLSLMY